MISMMIYDRSEEEGKVLLRHAQNSVAKLSDDFLKASFFQSAKDTNQFLSKRDLIDAAFVDVTDKNGIILAKKTREIHEMTELLIVADSSVSPMEYMTPSIRAASLLLRPFAVKDAGRIVGEFFNALYRNREETDDTKALIVENRDGKMPIPFSEIYYLEVREKRVFVRLKEREYSKYDTLDNISNELPEEFLRCHRSFIVNTRYISRVKLSENMIYLEDDICVPLSRSYKADMKEYMNGLRKV